MFVSSGGFIQRLLRNEILSHFKYPVEKFPTLLYSTTLLFRDMQKRRIFQSILIFPK